MLRRLTRSKFVRDTLILQVGKLVVTGTAFIGWIVVVRLMGLESYGIWGLAVALVGIWQSLQLTGVGLNLTNRLPQAIAQSDTAEVLNLLAFYTRARLAWSLTTVVLLALLAPSIALALYADERIGRLAAVFAVTLLADDQYTLVVVSLQSRRLMARLALLQTVNQLVLFVCMIAAMLIAPTPESLVAARLVYSYTTLLLAYALYERARTADPVAFPPLRAVFAAMRRARSRGYWRRGFVMALDKNAGNLFHQVPISLVGALVNPAAAGALKTALDGINRSTPLTAAVLDNLQAVVPHAVGRADYAGLWHRFGRVLAVMAAFGVLFYALLALLAPFAFPLLLGGEAGAAALAPFVVLALTGAITAAGGTFGALYRALDRTGAALAAKGAAWAIMLPLGVVLVTQAGAVGGAWLVNGLYAISVGGTALVTLSALRRAAQAGSSSK